VWFYKALLTSVISAIAVIVSKKLIKGVSATVLTWAALVLSTPIILFFALKDGLPELNHLFFVGVIGSVLFYTVSKVIGFKAIRMADLSTIYPLVAIGPLFTLLVATLPPLSEKPDALSLLGALITLIGVYILNVASLKEGIFKPISSLFKNKASLLMIISVLIDSVVIAFDKLAINNTFPKNTTFTLLIENLFIIFGLLPILFIRIRNFPKQIISNSKLFLFLGLLNATSTILAFSAVGGGNIGLVATILKTQILLVLFFSYIFFKDRPKVETLIGSAIVVLGVILIKIGV
jgi:drug/metabolite transporter (DMT)-like permease